MKRFAIYPYLFIIYLALNLLSHNLAQINISQSFRSILSLLVLTGLVILVLRLLLKDWRLASYIVFLFLFFFFVNGHIYRVVQDLVSLPNATWLPLLSTLIWPIVVAILGIIFWRIFPNKEDLTLFLNIVFLFVLLPAGYRFLQDWRAGSVEMVSAVEDVQNRNVTSAHGDLLDLGDIKLETNFRPDIYVIILDGYGRSDVLNELYDYDNRNFISDLEDRGFYVAEDSRTNYIQTLLSLSALLNFDYFKDWTPQQNVSTHEKFAQTSVANNRLFELLNKLDYTIIAVDNTYEVHQMQGIDQRLNPFIKLNHFERLLLSGTPLVVEKDIFRLGFLPIQSFEAHRQLVLFSFEQLGNLANMPNPKFVFVHIVSPHPPFVFDQDGKSVQPDHAFTWSDGSYYKGERDAYINGYRQQAVFVTSKIISTIDSILENSDEPPIIVLQSDHGPGSLLNWEAKDETCLWERASILNAYYLPGYDLSSLYSEITPVNTFRLILDVYFGANLELLEDRVYYTPWVAPVTMTDITAATGLKENCFR